MASVYSRVVLLKFEDSIDVATSADNLSDYFSDSRRSSGGPIDAAIGQKGFIETDDGAEVIIGFQREAGTSKLAYTFTNLLEYIPRFIPFFLV